MLTTNVIRVVTHKCGHKSEQTMCCYGIEQTIAKRAAFKCEECRMYEPKDNVIHNPEEIEITFDMM